MNTRHLILTGLAALAALLVTACNAGKPLQTEVRDYADSTAHSFLTLHAELPVPADAAAKAIRGKLVDMMDTQLSQITFGEPQRYFPRFEGNTDDTDALMAYYQDQTLSLIGRLSQEDADERERYIREDGDLSEEEKAEILANSPAWGYEFNLKKIADTLGYVVFQSQNYIYQGGAHGGITGDGYLTFDRKTGRYIEATVDPACTAAIQPLLVKGLLGYYSEFGEKMAEEEMRERLQIEGDLIPLPAWTPYPTAEGLCFVYQQYEIASYADGMPSFIVPFDEIQPFLTAEAKQVLGR